MLQFLFPTKKKKKRIGIILTSKYRINKQKFPILKKNLRNKTLK